MAELVGVHSDGGASTEKRPTSIGIQQRAQVSVSERRHRPVGQVPQPGSQSPRDQLYTHDTRRDSLMRASAGCELGKFRRVRGRGVTTPLVPTRVDRVRPIGELRTLIEDAPGQ
jgi:hypothetical protein